VHPGDKGDGSPDRLVFPAFQGLTQAKVEPVLLQVKSRQEKGVVIVMPRGHLTLDSGSQLHEEIRRAVQGGGRPVLIDLSHETYDVLGC
jgi:hypothetical protein